MVCLSALLAGRVHAEGIDTEHLFGFMIGILAPLIPWVLNKFFPHPNWSLINIPLFCQQKYTSANQAFIVVPFALNFIFNKMVYKYRREWWEKYNFIMSIGLDYGMTIAALIIVVMQAYVETTPLPNHPFNPVSLDFYCLEKDYTM